MSLLLFAAAPAFADKCVDPIVDETNLLSATDKTQIEGKINALRAQGAETHIHILTSYHRNASGEMMKSLTEYKQYMQAKCGTWKAPDGGFKNNMVLVLVVPKKFSESTKKGAPYALFYGSQWSAKLNPHLNGILNSMEGNFREQKWGAGVVTGLTDISDLIAVTPSQASKPIVINHSADYSGVWGSAVSWFFGLIFLALLAFAVVYFLRKRGANDTAQRAAQTERGKCSVYENSFETEHAGLKARIVTTSVTPEWKELLLDMLDQAEAQQGRASANLSGLNRSSNNPDTPRLSQEAYAAMAERYASVVAGYEIADALLKAAAADFEKAKRGESIKDIPRTANVSKQSAQPRQQHGPQTRRDGHSGSGSGSARRPAPPPAPQPTVVHHHRDRDSNDGFLTGVIVGSVLNDHHHHDHDRGMRSEDAPVINFPTAPADLEGGGERATSSSGDGGGGERIVSFSGDGGGGERDSTPAPAPAESSWTGGGGTSY